MLDTRSLRINDEANLNVHREPFAPRPIELFEQDLTRRQRVTVERFAERPWYHRVGELLTVWLSPQWQGRPAACPAIPR